MTAKPTIARRRLIDTTIRNLKSAGLWDKFDLFYILAAHDEQAGRVNWKSPSANTLSVVNSPTFTANTGFTTNGTDNRLNTGWAPSDGVNFTQNSAGLSAWVTSSAAATNPAIGTATVADVFLQPRNGSNNLVYRVNQAGSTTAAGVATAAGFSAVYRSGASATKSRRNGADLGSAGSAASTSRSAVQIEIGRCNTTFAIVGCAALILSSNLSDAEDAALYAIMRTYMTAVGVP